MNKNKIEDWTGEIHQGDAVETLSEMPESSIHSSVTSPPYLGLRDYDIENQIGLEDSVSEYIDEIVRVGEGLKRVLREDGSWWLNIGDIFSGSGYHHSDGKEVEGNPSRPDIELERKNKVMLPHRTAIALQKAGWIVRNDVVWYKRNAMPNPVEDRLSCKFEFLFHLTLNPDYWYNLDNIKEPGVTGGEKNPGDVFNIPTSGYSDVHCAVFPPDLIEKPIKSTCPKRVCESCGSPFDCDCGVDAKPGVVLDPFAGSGTTMVVAENHGREWVGIELNPDYIELSEKRIRNNTGILQENPLDY